MKTFRILTFVFLLFLSLAPTRTSAWVAEPKLLSQKDFTDGCVYQQYKHDLTGTFHFVKVKLSSKKWRVKPSINQKSITQSGSIKELAMASSSKAICAINASFFDPGNYPVGTVVIDGKIVSLDNRERSMLGIKGSEGIVGITKPKAFITSDDYFEPIYIWGYNHPPKSDSIIVYNRHWGKRQITLPANSVGLVISGDEVTSIIDKGTLTIPDNGSSLIFMGKSREHSKRFKVGTKPTLGIMMPDKWEGVTDIITGGPRLIDNGRVVDFKKYNENFASSYFKKHRRSIAGFTWNDEFFFAIFPTEVTYENLSSVLIEINVKDAIGLDGGSSSSFWVNSLQAINASKKIPVALAVIPRDENETTDTIPFFKNPVKKQTR